jgi:hypothetical protein
MPRHLSLLKNNSKNSRKSPHATSPFYNNNNNNNQAFYSQASWGRLEMKPHEQKNQGQKNSEKEGENKGR